VSDTDGLSWAVAGLTACLEHADAAGVRLLYENHVRGATWTANDFTQPAARFLEIMRRTAATRLGILFDTANNLALDDIEPLALLEQVADRVKAVHLSDLRRHGAFEPVRLGEGVAPIAAVLNALVAIGFDGWISIEEASRSGPEAFPAAVAFADAAWIGAGGNGRAS
jgi:sugar phosphate isomerase/epimerase